MEKSPTMLEKLGLSPKHTVIVKTAICSIIFISGFIFADFFVSLSFMVAILIPLYLLNVYLIQNIYQGFRQMNLS